MDAKARHKYKCIIDGSGNSFLWEGYELQVRRPLAAHK
jgi:hypothetical protein